jgi:Nucleotidyltransferase domain
MGKGDVMSIADWAPQHVRPYAEAVIAAIQDDPRVVGLTAGGSAVTGTMDEFSDLDLVVVCRDEHQPEMLAGAHAFAAGLGPLLACFTGEHVGEPRLLIALYGPPPVHVDLKFVTDSQLDQRVENGLILWQRDGALDAAWPRATPAWPQPEPQWIEDRFWVWVHYGATKLGRGELFECLDMLAAVRAMVLGPLIARASGHRAAGVRRLEQMAPGLVPALEATVGDHTPHGCAAALRASVALYRQLRDDTPELVRRTGAEAVSLDYLAQIEARLPELGYR